MREFDKNLIKRIITDNVDLIKEAVIGMKEDWSWTAQSIFDKDAEEKYLIDIDNEEEMHLIGSTWATPTIMLAFNDNSTKMYNCFFGSKDNSVNSIRQEYMVKASHSIISGSVQDMIDQIENESYES